MRPFANCRTCNALPSVLAHHAETSFVLTGTDLQPYWFDHINTVSLFLSENMPGRLSPPFLNLTRHGNQHKNPGWASGDPLVFPLQFDPQNIPLFSVLLFLFFLVVLSIIAIIYITRHLRGRRRMNYIYDPSSIMNGPVGPNDQSMINMDLHSHLFLSDACRHALVERYRNNHCGPVI
ncbi:hypothetical protein PFISCL1PPCAC_28371 [Pristionchus fissidentatus]|uniref:Uncharacterized protein n=1 Tax=Pristionchus fissidentatus TaxID=1538716 RepID=A0AAV5X4J2_9BILA|nr:hypothetical protein PFISCL1PPCAC_7263 [Pristionchus fissidentatus]GMT37074.1 hypothetical protein PFISCL1PPCAC_28371 [Pristionchus fissidentatus]